VRIINCCAGRLGDEQALADLRNLGPLSRAALMCRRRTATRTVVSICPCGLHPAFLGPRQPKRRKIVGAGKWPSRWPITC